MFLNRLDNIFINMEKYNFNQIIVSDINSIFYLTGKWIYPGERMLALLLRKNNKPVLFLNDLFDICDNDLLIVKYNDSESGVFKMLKYIDKNDTLGIDKAWPSRFLLELINFDAAKNYKNSSICVDSTRAIKDNDEIKLMIESSKLNDLCINEMKNSLRLGMSELEMQNKCYEIYKSHNLSTSFTPIVAFKANAADAHHEPDDKTKLALGDMVLLDVGGKYNNYCSDMTRVFFTKEPTDFEKYIYNLVRKANEEAIKAIKPGVRLKDIDKIARDVISNEGYGKYFTHRLGHFIGIEDHDFGDVSESSDIIAETGMIFSIEPGIYIKDKIGVRIEDLVMVTKDGVMVLNEYPKNIEVLDLRWGIYENN